MDTKRRIEMTHSGSDADAITSFYVFWARDIVSYDLFVCAPALDTEWPLKLKRECPSCSRASALQANV